jgi:hypothetical protein
LFDQAIRFVQIPKRKFFFRSNSRQELVLVTISIIFAYVTMVDGEPRLPVVGDIPAGLPGFMSGSQLDGEHDLLRCGNMVLLKSKMERMFFRST